MCSYTCDGCMIKVPDCWPSGAIPHLALALKVGLIRMDVQGLSDMNHVGDGLFEHEWRFVQSFWDWYPMLLGCLVSVLIGFSLALVH
ncbi:hypothetical protein KC19_11G155000 [Ceratodon purpureus]|uniref:Uncharacterized protein n=1 Tax=Ceratodon purpureus TaxID=3225 RepID=A0A8T0GJ43_CERPU|nr:hypothetical protein KC19_11G155000 [Ceratodon purpureus]